MGHVLPRASFHHYVLSYRLLPQCRTNGRRTRTRSTVFPFRHAIPAIRTSEVMNRLHLGLTVGGIADIDFRAHDDCWARQR
jgi:hypothetical protein